MKFTTRSMLILILVVVVQPGIVFADTARNSTAEVVSYSGSFVYDSTSSFTAIDRLFANRDRTWTLQDIVSMPIADAQNVVSSEEIGAPAASAADVEPDDLFDLLRPERSSGERIVEAPIEAAIVPEPMSFVLLASGLLPRLGRKWNG